MDMKYDGKFEDTSVLPTSFVCEICGSAAFSSEGGFYFCNVCSTQSQETREYVQDEDERIQRASAVTRAGVIGKTIKPKKKAKDDERILLSSWEVFNLVLKAMTDKLINIGFPALLKDEVFKLWRAYLMKRDVILCENDSNPVQSRSSVSVGEPRTNLKSLYKWKFKRRAQKRKATPKVDSPLARKRADGKLRRKAFETAYLKTATQLQESQSLFPETEDGDFPSKPKLTPAAKVVCNEMKQRHRPFIIQPLKNLQSCVKSLLRHEMFQFKNVLILLFIACRQIGCRVLITDLVRLVCDGTIFVNSIKTLLGFEAVSTHSMAADIFLRTILNFWDNPRSMSSMIKKTIDFVGVKTFQYPTFQEFLPKFMEDCCLPRELEGLLLQINKMFSDTEDILELGEGNRRWKIYIEVMITSMIGLILRMLFGLDDITEKYQSNFAAKVNEIMSKHMSAEHHGDARAEWTNLFEIGNWFQFIRYRESFLQQERLNSMMFLHGKPPNLNRANDISSRYTIFGIDNPPVPETRAEPDVIGSMSTGMREEIDPKFQSRRFKLYSAATSYRHIFHEAAITQNGGPITEVPNYISLPCPNQSVLEEFQRSKPNVSYPNYDTCLLSSDFKKMRIDYIYNPEKYIPLLEKAGYRVKIIPGMYTQLKKPLKARRRTLYLFQPYKKFTESIDTGAPFSASMGFLIDYLCKYIHVEERRPRNKLIILDVMEKLTHLYTLRSLNGFIPLIS